MLFLKRSPTLLAGLIVFLAAVVLLGGRSLMAGVRAEASGVPDRQTANANVATVAVDNAYEIPAGCCGGGSGAYAPQETGGGGCCGGL